MREHVPYNSQFSLIVDFLKKMQAILTPDSSTATAQQNRVDFSRIFYVDMHVCAAINDPVHPRVKAVLSISALIDADVEEYTS